MMGWQKYRLRPAPRGREQLRQLTRGGKSPARKMARTRILLKTAGDWNAPEVAEAWDISVGCLHIGQSLMESEKNPPPSLLRRMQ